MTDAHEISLLLPAPPTSAPTPAEHRRIDAALAGALRHEAAVVRRRERGLRLAGPAVVATSVLTVVGWCALAVGGPAAPVDRSRPVVAAPAAVEVLHHASQAVLVSGSSRVVGADQYVYTRSRVVSNEGAFGDAPTLGAPHEREIWLSQDPQAVEEVGVIRELGQDWPIGSGSPSPVGPSRPTYEWLQSLPTDPDDLLTEIESDVGLVDAGLDRDQVVFMRIGDLVREGLVPPRVAAALFEAATRIPGVTVDPGATDALGRRGTGISRADRAVRSVWVLDPSSYEVLGTRDYFVGPGPDVLFGATAVLERGVADRVGERPSGPSA